MMQSDRRNRIINHLKETGNAKVEDLAELLGVSSMTIRRDLEHLEKRNQIIRYFGGAVIKSDMTLETPYKDKIAAHTEIKRLIAWEAIRMIKDGQIIMLDSGTTTMEIARQLKHFNSLTVVTSDVRIASYLAMNTNIEVLCTGGLVQNRTGACIGGMAAAFLKDLDVDIVFMGISSINDDLYLCTPSLEKAEVKRQMVHAANKLVLLADSSKFHKKNFVKVCHLKEVTDLITDKKLDSETIERIRKLKLELKLV